MPTPRTGDVVVLDTMVIAHLIEPHPVFHAMVVSFFNRLDAGDVRGVISTVLFAELLVPFCRPVSTTPPDAVLAGVLGLRNIAVHAPDTQICLEAARLRATYNLRTPDAIHAATAIMAKADGIVTNDRRWRRLSREGLKIWMIDELT